jgi:transcriptional antiterminator NusG
MSTTSLGCGWYAVRVNTKAANSVANLLTDTGHTVFHPTYREVRRWSDRTKVLEVSLFNGYLFCQLDISYRLSIIMTPGVIDFVSFGKSFLPVPEQEIDSIRRVVNSGVSSRPHPYLRTGEHVIVERGPLAGVEGILVRQKNDAMLVLSVHLLQRSVITEVDLDAVRPVRTESILMTLAGESEVQRRFVVIGPQ